MSNEALSNRLVEFLASYGPQPSSNSLYDEFVIEAAQRTKCAPLEIKQPVVAELEELLRSDGPCSVILTGTAGDGKTYTARKVIESLAGPEKRWQNTQKLFDLSVRISSATSRRLHFIKDLSELNEADKEEVFPRVRRSLCGDSNEIFIICVNDGHLLKFFRDRGAQGTSLHDRIAQMLQRDERDDPDGNFCLINMSRHADPELMDSVIDAIVYHPDWSRCAGCSAYLDTENPCPIWCNLWILHKTGGASMRARLRDMARIAAHDRRHLSIRQLILLAVNILLGDKKPGRALLTCQRARNRATAGDYFATNPYANAFGENLNPRERERYGAFAILREFGVGFETNNYFDHSLLGGRSGLPVCGFYGDRIFTAQGDRYYCSRDANQSELRRQMIDQRRRLFFSIDPLCRDARGNRRRDFWNLSVFNYGADYIEMADALALDAPRLPAEIRRHLVRGLNRIMTGEMTATDDRIWITAPSGVYLGREIPLLVTTAGSKRQGSTYVTFPKSAGNSTAPVLRLTPIGREDLSIDLVLRPTLFECLLRIASGALAASFSSECQQIVQRFQLRVAAAVFEAYEGISPPLQQVEMINRNLQSRSVDIMVTEDDWQ